VKQKLARKKKKEKKNNLALACGRKKKVTPSIYMANYESWK